MLQCFNYKAQSVPSENNTQIKKGGNFISENDYLDDETFNELMQNYKAQNLENDDNPKARNYEDIKDEDRKKTDLMKSECMATLYEIDVNIVTHIANLDQCTLNVTKYGFHDLLDNIFQSISNSDDKYKNLIKKCYINLFFFGKEFKVLASMYYRSGGVPKSLESKFKDRFESENDKERAILGNEYIEYFRTTWNKRKSYLDEQIKLIDRKKNSNDGTADLDDEFELYSQLQKNYDLNKEISKSNVEGKLDKYNFPGYNFYTGKNDFYADFIQHIGKKVEDFYCSSFENFFFGYLCVMKNISQKYNITNKYLPEFQKCYIQKFLLWHRDNEKSEKINRQFLLDMYFFFNKDKNSGKPQNIFGEGIKNYFYDCIKQWFSVTDEDLTFDAKLKYIQSSVVDEIQFLEMDQIEKSGIRIMESPDKERAEKEFKQINAFIISNNIKDKKESQNEVNVDQNSNSETIRL